MTVGSDVGSTRVEIPPDAVMHWYAPHPTSVRQTLGTLRHGGGDPTVRFDDVAAWRTLHTSAGPASIRYLQLGPCRLAAQAWGAGAQIAVDEAPETLGSSDDSSDFIPRHRLVADLHRRHPGLRIPRTRRVVDSIVPAVIEQRVTGAEAFRAFAFLARRLGNPAPGPVPRGMLLPPTVADWRALPEWEWHRAGVDPGRMRTIRGALAVADRLEECADLPRAVVYRRLTSLPGIGVWTAAEVAQRALGDADAISYGDYHIAKNVGHLLAGCPFTDDEMLAALRPYAPHRQRVVRLLELSGRFARERHGARLTIQDHRSV